MRNCHRGHISETAVYKHVHNSKPITIESCYPGVDMHFGIPSKKWLAHVTPGNQETAREDTEKKNNMADPNAKEEAQS